MSTSSSRFSSIEGLLAAQPAPTKHGKRYALPTDQEDQKSTEVSCATQRVRETAPVRPASARKQSRTARVAFRLPPVLKDRLVDRALSDRCSQADMIKNAIEYAQISGSLDGAFDETPTGSLFTRSQRTSATASVPSEIRLLTSERDLIDDLVQEYGAKDRTALIVKALHLYFN